MYFYTPLWQYFEKEYYEFWKVKMKTHSLFVGLRRIVDKDHKEVKNEANSHMEIGGNMRLI